MLSIIVPVYGCALCLPALYKRTKDAVSQITIRYEIIFVDDCSIDEAWSLIERFALNDKTVRGYRLKNNSGQTCAIAAGLSRSQGRWMVVMDCDLQDPPEDIARLFAAREGRDVVVCEFSSRSRSFWRHIASNIYFVILRIVTNNPLAGRCSNFSLASREIVEKYLGSNKIGGSYITAVSQMAHKIGKISFNKTERHTGKSAYTLSKLVRAGALGFSCYLGRFLAFVILPLLFISMAILLIGLVLLENNQSIHVGLSALLFSFTVILFTAGMTFLTLRYSWKRRYHPFEIVKSTDRSENRERQNYF